MRANEATGTQSMRGHAPAAWRRGWFAGLVILSLAYLESIPVAHASCRLAEIAEFHVDLVGNSPIIDGQINGHPIRILLETGSPVSFITHTAARQLDLPIRSYKNQTIIGVGGNESLEIAVVKELKIGDLELKNHTTNVVGTEIHDANGVATFQLGADVLSHFVTEWDLAHGIVRLLHPQDCSLEQLAYWSSGYFQVELDPSSLAYPSVVLKVKINGKSTKAKLVSASAISHIAPEAARDAGVEPGGPNAEPAREITGLTANPIPTWIGRFDTFEVGSETIKNARLRIGALFPIGKNGGPGSGSALHLSRPVREPTDISLGADFLLAHHLIIVPEKQVALFTHNGGAVFQPERPE
jgi:hypothetical protein